MKIPNFVLTFIGRKAANRLDLKEGYMEDKKKWYLSKNIWTGITTALIGLYLTLAPQFGLPAIPEWIFTLLGAAGIYTRVKADTKIG